MFPRSTLALGIARVLDAFGHRADELRGTTTLGDRLCEWAERVVEWNQRIDLTAARSAEELVDLLVADAALLASTVESNDDDLWVDVGSGAGAPGLGLALLAPRLSMTLVEPKTKRVAFLRSVLGTLERSDVRVERKRSDELPSRICDVAVSRATLEPSVWLGEGARLARRRVWVLLAQQQAPEHPGYVRVRELEYQWPLTRTMRRAVAYEAKQFSPASQT